MDLTWTNDFSFLYCALFAALGLWELRDLIFDMLIGSFKGKWQKYNSCRKQAVAVRKQQSFFHRLTMLYIGEHVSAELRGPYKRYMALRALDELLLLYSIACAVFPPLCPAGAKKYVVLLSLVLLITAWFVLYDPWSKRARRLNRYFPG